MFRADRVLEWDAAPALLAAVDVWVLCERCWRCCCLALVGSGLLLPLAAAASLSTRGGARQRHNSMVQM